MTSDAAFSNILGDLAEFVCLLCFHLLDRSTEATPFFLQERGVVQFLWRGNLSCFQFYHWLPCWMRNMIGLANKRIQFLVYNNNLRGECKFLWFWGNFVFSLYILFLLLKLWLTLSAHDLCHLIADKIWYIILKKRSLYVDSFRRYCWKTKKGIFGPNFSLMKKLFWVTSVEWHLTTLCRF